MLFPAPQASSDIPDAIPRRLRRLLDAGLMKGFWAMGDQAIVSIGNFATSIILVRNLPPRVYGGFGIMLEMIFFLNAIQGAVVNYPLQLDGAKLDSKKFQRFATGCLILAVVATLPLMLVMAATGGIVAQGLSVRGQWLQIATLGAAAAAMWQMQEMLRRALMSQLRFAAVLPGDAISYLGQAVGLMLVAHQRRLALPDVFLIMAGTSAAAAAVQAYQVGLEPFSFRDVPPLARQFWNKGRWLLASCFATLITGNSFSWVLAGTYGLAEVARFQVLGIFLKLSNPLMSSITSLITPAVSRAHAQHDARLATRKALKYGLLGAALLMPYYFVLIFAPRLMMKILFRSDTPYVDDHMLLLLRIFVLNNALIYIANILGAVLNGLAQSKFGFFAQVLNIVVTLTIALPLTAWLGVTGAVLGGLACVAVWAGSHAWFLAHVVRKSDGQSAVSPENPREIPANEVSEVIAAGVGLTAPTGTTLPSSGA